MNLNCDSSTCEANVVIHKHRCNCSMGQKNCSVNVMGTLNKIGKSVITQSVKKENTEAVQLQTTQSPTNDSATAQYSIIIGLGISVGVLVVVLVGMTIGWIWTCWIMSKRGHVIINLKQNRER